jgi:hypothetical protein
MGPPTAQSYSDFVAQGEGASTAIRSAMGQIREKVFAYPPEAAIKPFIDLALQRGALEHGSFTPMVLDDPLTVNAMISGRAQFQTGGVPSRLVLQKAGFQPVLRAVDLAKTAQASPDSPELAGILENGWATTRAFFEDNHDTILRLASVNYRIIQYISDHPREAAAIHMPYLSSVTGEEFSLQDADIIYSDLDPFVTFRDQYEWFNNPGSIFYYKNINGAILNSFIKQGIYKGSPPNLGVVAPAAEVYKELDGLRIKAEGLLQRIRKSPDGAKVSTLVDTAQRQYDDFNFLDAAALAEKASAQIGLQ